MYCLSAGGAYRVKAAGALINFNVAYTAWFAADEAVGPWIAVSAWGVPEIVTSIAPAIAASKM